MRRGARVALGGGLGLLAGLFWLLGAPAREGGARVAMPREERTDPAPLALLEPDSVAVAPALSPRAGPEARERRARPERPRASGEAAAGPVVGRLVVHETGDPIEGTFSIRLRTIDLLRSEELASAPDGRFRGRTLFPRSVVLALVKDAEGRELVDHEALFDPEAEGDWLVRVPEAAWPTFARGTLVNRRGALLAEGKVALVPLAAELPHAEQEVFGEPFELYSLRAGPYRLLAQGRWARMPPLEVRLRAGPNELGSVVVDEPESGGDLRIVLDPGAGPWPSVRGELRGEGGDFLQRFDTSLAEVDEAGRARVEIASLPAGRYLLALEALDGRALEPERLAFSPPAELRIEVSGEASPGLLFRARDARTGEPVSGFSVFGRVLARRTWTLFEARRRGTRGARFTNEPLEELRLPPGFEAWVAWAPGYQAAFGRCGDGEGTVVVALEPGWSELLQFEDAEGTPVAPLELQRFLSPPVLASVEVRVDGVLAGLSDEDGFLALAAEREPQEIACARPGWRVVTEYRLGILRTLVLARQP